MYGHSLRNNSLDIFRHLYSLGDCCLNSKESWMFSIPLEVPFLFLVVSDDCLTLKQSLCYFHE